MPIILPDPVPGVFEYLTTKPPPPENPPTDKDICRAVVFESDVVHRYSERFHSHSPPSGSSFMCLCDTCRATERESQRYLGKKMPPSIASKCWRPQSLRHQQTLDSLAGINNALNLINMNIINLNMTLETLHMNIVNLNVNMEAIKNDMEVIKGDIRSIHDEQIQIRELFSR
ncbi:hypothetical protein PM082_022595 [Marasmius tenuissimus]|nr:hypothetical protein PM082_022595 [Marasmius tenuissimus]